MRVLFDFQPDDAPAETIEVFGADRGLITELHAFSGSGNATVTLTARVYGEDVEPHSLLFRVSRISNVREVS